MDYYQELGLKPTATVEEIRQAYKLLARLVHPDGQTDPQLRAMGDRQMQRLNEILSTLTDEPKRKEYDSTLLVLSAPRVLDPQPLSVSRAVMPHWHRPTIPEPVRMDWRNRLPEWAQTALQYTFWAALGIILISVAIWYMAQDRSSAPMVVSPSATMTRDARTHSAESGKKVAGKPQPILVPTPEPEEATVTPTPLPVDSETLSRDPEESAATKQPAYPVAEMETPVPVTPEHSSAARDAELSFAGNWFHVPGEEEKPSPGSYPVTYVELLLGEERDELSGSYRARYQIPDVAVSPEVSFRVDGKCPKSPTAKLRWTSPDGASGEVEMTLRGPNRMQVTWWTTKQGRRAALASGTANLVRQQTR